MNSDLINALIAAATSLAVVVLSQFLIHIKDQSQLREKEMDAVLKEYFNPIRFMLSENYFRISRIVSEVKREGNAKKLLTVNYASEIAGKEDEWFCREFCMLLKNGQDLIWYSSIIDFFLRLGRGRYQEAEYILKDIGELTHYIDHAVSGGDSIEQKMQAERDAADRRTEI